MRSLEDERPYLDDAQAALGSIPSKRGVTVGSRRTAVTIFP